MLKTTLIVLIIVIVIVLVVLFFMIRAARRRNDIEHIFVDKVVDNVMQYWDKAPGLREKEDPVDNVFQDAELSPQPEFESVTAKETDEQIDDRLEEAARLVVATQDCSRRHLQRTLAIGYAHAGRILDQLEAAGIIGPMDESQQREILMKDPGDVEPALSLFGFLPGSQKPTDLEPKVNIDDMYLDIMNE